MLLKDIRHWNNFHSIFYKDSWLRLISLLSDSEFMLWLQYKKRKKTSSLDLWSSVVYEVIALGQSERISETCYADQPKTGKERESCLWQWVWGYHRAVSQRVTVGQSQRDGEHGRRIWTLFTQCVLSYLHFAPYYKTHTGQFKKTDRKLQILTMLEILSWFRLKA